MRLTDPGVEWRDRAAATYGHDVSPRKPAEPGQVWPTAPLRAKAEAREVGRAPRGRWTLSSAVVSCHVRIIMALPHGTGLAEALVDGPC